jgi:hypothetical protein
VTKNGDDMMTMTTTENVTKNGDDMMTMTTTENVTKNDDDMMTMTTTENVTHIYGRPWNTCKERDYRGKWPGTLSVKHYGCRNPTNIGNAITGEKIGMNMATTNTSIATMNMMITIRMKMTIFAPITRRPLNWRPCAARLRNCVN